MTIGAIVLQMLTEPDWLTQIIVALTALLAVPAVNSTLIGVIQRAGIHPRLLAYGFALVAGLAVVATDPPALPTFSPQSPEAFVSAWLLIASGFASFTEGLYQKFLRKFTLFNPA